MIFALEGPLVFVHTFLAASVAFQHLLCVSRGPAANEPKRAVKKVGRKREENRKRWEDINHLVFVV